MKTVVCEDASQARNQVSHLGQWQRKDTVDVGVGKHKNGKETPK